MDQTMRAHIIGMGSYLPERILSNADLEQMVETSDEWIFSRTGIKERRIAGKDECTSDMGSAAAHKALADAGITADDIDLILVATMSPDYLSNSTAAIIQKQLHAKQAAAMDIQAACSGFLYALATAKAFIEAGMYKKILLVASEKMSTFVDYKDRSTCILFGDGAAAAVISAEEKGFSIENVLLGADGELADLLLIPAGGAKNPPTHETVERHQHFIKMSGSELFKHAVRRMGNAAKESLEKAQLTVDQITWMVPHQANSRIIDAVAKTCLVPDEKVYTTLARFGNTSASSIPLALDDLRQNETLKPGDTILLAAFGAGLTWGSGLLKVVT